MSEAIILYRGRGGVDPESLKPQTITSNGTYKAPVTGNYWVAVVGGGGGGGGGCRNSWNVSQVFYGAGGTRGTLNAGNVFLNAGDEVSVTLGAGGSAGVNNTTVISNNSRGTNGGTGSTSAFGSYRSGAGGAVGGYSWHYHYWTNTNMGWSNVITGWTNTPVWQNEIRAEHWHKSDYLSNFEYCGIASYRTSNYGKNGWYCYGCRTYLDDFLAPNLQDLRFTEVNTIARWNNNPVYSNTIKWDNKVTNTTTRCYTSIQQGTWWYLNNNQVSTSGTRTYRSDGGASGRAGNAGFVVIVPPTI